MNTSSQQAKKKLIWLLIPHLDLDLIVYIPEHIKKRLEWDDLFLEEICVIGIPLYER